MFRRAAILTVVCGVAFGTFGARSLHAQSSSAQDPPAAPSPVSKVPKATGASLSRRAAQRSTAGHARSRAILGRGNTEHLHAWRQK